MNRDQALLNKLRKKRIIVQNKKRGLHKGSRQSNKFGSSLEFSDFRAYQHGDDIRQIDWNVYGRTQKHYIKRFLDEQELSIAIYLDSTSSMSENPAKWQLAKELAASLGFIALAGEDRLTFTAVSSLGVQPVKRKGSVYSRMTFLDILNLEQRETSVSFFKQLHHSLSKNQQLNILITDGLEPVQEIEAIMKRIKAFKQEFWFVQVLSEEEISPTFAGDLKLIDIETGSAVNVSMNKAIISDYRKRIQVHNIELEQLCRRFGGHYLLITDKYDLQTILFKELSGKGLIS